LKSLGTWIAEANAERFLEDCENWVEDKLRVQAYRYFFGEGLGEAYTLVSYMRPLLEEHRAALARCLHYVVLENRSEGAPPLGPGALAQLLSELCRKHGAKCLLHVGGCGETAASGFCSGKGLQPAEEGRDGHHQEHRWEDSGHREQP